MRAQPHSTESAQTSLQMGTSRQHPFLNATVLCNEGKPQAVLVPDSIASNDFPGQRDLTEQRESVQPQRCNLNIASLPPSPTSRTSPQVLTQQNQAEATPMEVQIDTTMKTDQPHPTQFGQPGGTYTTFSHSPAQQRYDPSASNRFFRDYSPEPPKRTWSHIW